MLLQSWYPVAKVISEKAALEYGRQTGLDVVTLNPGLVFGPLLQPMVNASSQFLIYLLKGLDRHISFSNVIIQSVDIYIFACPPFNPSILRSL
jgi:nucleoside-diphosphate-sugar epimerase